MTTTRRFLRSAGYATSIKLIHRSIGFISTLILARLLAPEAFAYIAVIAIVVRLFDILSHTGAETYLIQKAQLAPDEVETAWTLELLLKCLLYGMLFLVALPVSVFLEMPELETGIQVAAAVIIIDALVSPRWVLLKRDLDYGAIFQLSLIQKLFSFVTVIALAWHWQSFWAFIVADIVASVVFTLGSYYLRPCKPRLTLKHVSSQWHFSKWMLGKTLAGFLRSQVDTLLVSKFFNPGVLGQYHLGRDLAMLPAHNLLAPMIEPMLAVFKNDQHQPRNLKHKLSITLMFVMATVIPIAAFLWWHGNLTVQVLLGDQWGLTQGLLPILSLLCVYWVLLLVMEQAMLALGHVRALFCWDALGLLLTVAVLSAAFYWQGSIEIVAWSRVGVGMMLMLGVGVVLYRLVGLAIGALLAVLVTASMLSLGAYWLTLPVFSLDWPLWAIFFAGGSAYVVSYLVLLAGIGLLAFCIPSLNPRVREAVDYCKRLYDQ